MKVSDWIESFTEALEQHGDLPIVGGDDNEFTPHLSYDEGDTATGLEPALVLEL